jgi:hypothetical protein
VKLFSANQIGLYAAESLKNNRSGEVIGITSKGMFLKLADQSIIFLSTGRFGNPLTINLNSDLSVSLINPGEPVHLADSTIRFEHSSTIVQTGKATIYSSKKLSNPLSAPPDLKQSIAVLLTLHSRLDHSIALLEEVLAFIGNSSATHSSEPETQLALERLVQNAIASPANCFHPIRFFAGKGRGLTPSGDDLLMGWIYTLGRWTGSPALDINQLHRVLFQAMENRTTSISLNLIKAAAHGEIDERLLHAFEMITGLRPVEDHAIQDVLEWGSSSGIEVCAGMGLGIFTLSRLIV